MTENTLTITISACRDCPCFEDDGGIYGGEKGCTYDMGFDKLENPEIIPDSCPMLPAKSAING